MKKSTRIWSVTATCLLCVGLVVMLAVLSACSWDFKKLSTSEFQVNTYTIEDEFSSIALDVDTTDISILPSEDGTCKVVCGEREKEEHRVTVENGVLTITFEDTRKWYEMVGFNFRKSSINSNSD